MLGRDGGRPAIAVLMAALTFLGAVVAALQSEASTAAARSVRAADAFALERSGMEGAAALAELRDTSAFRRWFSLLEDGAWARDAESEASGDDAVLYEALARVDDELSEWVRGQSTLLQPPYYSTETFVVDFSGYTAAGMAEPLRAQEQARAENEVADAHGARAAAYVTVLTIVAVALFFLGLASTVAARPRRVFASVGVLLAGITAIWTVTIAMTPVAREPAEAIDAIVRSNVSLVRAGSGEPGLMTDAVRPTYESAIRDAETAVAISPDSVAGHRALGQAALFYANARIFSSETPGPETDALVDRAVAAYERAIELGDADSTTWWNLGFAQYLAGDADAAIHASNKVISRTPTQFVPYVNRAVAEASAGYLLDSASSVATAIAVARDSNIDTNGAFFANVDQNLTRLAVLRPSEAEGLRKIQRALREARVALRVRDGTAPDAAAPALDSVTLTGLAVGADGTVEELDTIEPGEQVVRTSLAGLRLSLAGLGSARGRSVSVRVWTNDSPDAGFARDVTVDGVTLEIDLVDPYGRARFDLTPGRWLVEVYVDAATRAAIEFEVVAADEPG